MTGLLVDTWNAVATWVPGLMVMGGDVLEVWKVTVPVAGLPLLTV